MGLKKQKKATKRAAKKITRRRKGMKYAETKPVEQIGTTSWSNFVPATFTKAWSYEITSAWHIHPLKVYGLSLPPDEARSVREYNLPEPMSGTNAIQFAKDVDRRLSGYGV